MQNKKEQRAQKLEMITQWQQSGLTQRAFCIANNVAYQFFITTMVFTDPIKTALIVLCQ